MRTAEQTVAAYHWLRVTEVALRTGWSRRHVLNLIAKGELRAANVGDPDARRKTWNVDPGSLADFMRRRTVQKAAA